MGTHLDPRFLITLSVSLDYAMKTANCRGNFGLKGRFHGCSMTNRTGRVKFGFVVPVRRFGARPEPPDGDSFAMMRLESVKTRRTEPVALTQPFA